ncbi:MAG: hypothetical protein JXQ75_04705 [Phycisphaerae bacterium]|nr:hypothetical protein [Phycisphaerae bacterium]
MRAVKPMLFVCLLVVGTFQGCMCYPTSLIVDAVIEVQLPPNGNAAALVVDQSRIPGGLSALLLDQSVSRPNLDSVINGIYMREFGQDVDFIMLVVNDTMSEYWGRFQDNEAFYQSVRFPDRGIGDNDRIDREVGPSSLRGYPVLLYRELLVTGAALHELGHAWAVYLTGPPSLVAAIHPPDANESEGHCAYHWNNANVDGLMGGWSPLRGVCDTCAYVPPVPLRQEFAPLELYLMGLAEPEEVPPLRVMPYDVRPTIDLGQFPAGTEVVTCRLTESGEYADCTPGDAYLETVLRLGEWGGVRLCAPTETGEDDCGEVVFCRRTETGDYVDCVAGDDLSNLISELICVDDKGNPLSSAAFEALVTTITIDDIIEHNGARIPSVKDSPKHFRIALVVLSTTPLTDNDWDFYERAIDFFAAPQHRSATASFPEALHPDFHSFLIEQESRTPDQPFLNFYMATDERATVEFVTLVSD